jgi:hypothetical protein
MIKVVKKHQWILGAGLIVAASFSRLLPHPYNFSPIAAMALLGGATLGKTARAFLWPLGALFLSDVCFQLFTSVPGFYGWGQLLNYGAFAVVVWIGMRWLQKISLKRVVLASVAASLLFFVLSNLGVWLFAGGVAPYTADASGLINTFMLGIPFLGNTLLGDLVYSGLLFGAYSLLAHLWQLKKAAIA